MDVEREDEESERWRQVIGCGHFRSEEPKGQEEDVAPYGPLRQRQDRQIVPRADTHHFKVLSSALGALEVAGQQHLVDVMASAVVKLPHVEGTWLEVMEISLHLQALQDALLHQVHVPDLIPG